MSGFGSKGGSYGRSNDFDYAGRSSSIDLFIPAGDCGKIIGRGGSKIRDLQDHTGCKINVSRDDEGDGTRRVELSGSDDAIEMARRLIAEVLEGGDDRRGGGSGGSSGGAGSGGSSSGGGGGPGAKEVMQIDSSFVGRIIGKGGSRIRELQDDTGCRINVSRDGPRHGQTDIELIGSRHSIKRARDCIDEITAQAY